MKNSQKIALIAFAAALAGTTIYLAEKRRKEKRLAMISNAGYEMAYDVHFPVKYKKGKSSIK